MRRREAIAGLASVGFLGGAGLVARGGLPSLDHEDEAGRDPSHDPLELQLVMSPGRDDETITIPTDGSITFVDLFATTCGICEQQMPALGSAFDRLDDEVTFVSVTNERGIADAAIAEWWDDHDGRWPVARDPASELVVHYGTSTPMAVLFDESGQVRWEEAGRKTAEEITGQIEQLQETA